jgi:thiamine-phosphate pyrophosphorylase
MSPTSILRILDASLNRAGEGLRVVEDYARFVLDEAFLTRQLKALRHDLASAATPISSAERHSARETQLDIGTAITTASETVRPDAWSVCAASLKRAEQALRSLEEYGKLIDGEFAGRCESLRYRLYTLEKALDVGRNSRMRLDTVRLCILVDGCRSAAEFESLVKSLVAAGPVMIQLRDKKLDDRDLVERGQILVAVTNTARTEREGEAPAEPSESAWAPRERRPPKTLAIINDRADIAAAVGADGVHLGQEDLSVKDARAIVGTEMLIGVSTHNIDQARAAVLDGANYLGAGPTFASQTKSFDSLAGLDYLGEVAGEISLPTFAIGGITPKNLPAVLATGISRVAVSGAITAAPKPTSAAREMLDILRSAIEKPRPPVATL